MASMASASKRALEEVHCPLRGNDDSWSRRRRLRLQRDARATITGKYKLGALWLHTYNGMNPGSRTINLTHTSLVQSARHSKAT